jgi:DNA-binding MarR family transcriptional regulator
MRDAVQARVATEQLVDAIKRFQDAVDLFDATAAQALDINPTDLRCLTALHDRGPIKASDVATQLGLTRGATTTALDRLQERKFISRGADATDGRGVIVELTPGGRKRVASIWAPMRRNGSEHLRSYSVRELGLLRRFFERSVELQASCTELLRTAAKGTSTKSSGRRSSTVERRKRGL